MKRHHHRAAPSATSFSGTGSALTVAGEPTPAHRQLSPAPYSARPATPATPAIPAAEESRARRDPRTWPALVHRVLLTWGTALRALFIVVGLLSAITGALLLLGTITLHIGPISIERTQ